MDLKDRLSDTLTDEELAEVRTSFDLVGDIAIIKVPDTLDHRTDVIAEAVMAQHPHVKTVLRKTGQRSGQERLADYAVVAGDGTETVHKEHGCRFRLDPTEVYFSERLGRERQRVVAQASAGETVIDMFAGIGPFAIMLARNADVGHVHAFELNDAAVAYLRENVALNNVEDRVSVYAGDVAETLPPLDITADRLIMNLPKQSDRYVDLAVRTAADGATVHYYTFVEEDDQWDAATAAVRDRFSDAGAVVDSIEHAVCGHYSPAVDRACFDVTLQ